MMATCTRKRECSLDCDSERRTRCKLQDSVKDSHPERTGCELPQINLQPPANGSASFAYTPRYPLTERNLRAWTHMSSANSTSQRQPTTASSVTHKSMASNRVLDAHRIYQDRDLPMPEPLQRLKQSILMVRNTDITPISKTIGSSWRNIKSMFEADAMAALENGLGYRGEFESLNGQGETNVFRSRNRQWNAGSVPVPIPPKDDEVARVVFDRAGIPPTPKPDITYGYTHDTFNEWQHQSIRSLNPECFVLSSEPWFPYWVVEWKSSARGYTIEQAETQARRDGAAAVQAMYQFYLQAGITDPGPERTAIFSAAIDSNLIHLRLHWRNQNAECFESDLIANALLNRPEDLFRIRSVILNILKWARTTRLKDIYETLDNCKDVIAKHSIPSPSKMTSKKSPKKSPKKIQALSSTALRQSDTASPPTAPEVQRQRTPIPNSVVVTTSVAVPNPTVFPTSVASTPLQLYDLSMFRQPTLSANYQGLQQGTMFPQPGTVFQQQSTMLPHQATMFQQQDTVLQQQDTMTPLQGTRVSHQGTGLPQPGRTWIPQPSTLFQPQGIALQQQGTLPPHQDTVLSPQAWDMIFDQDIFDDPQAQHAWPPHTPPRYPPTQQYVSQDGPWDAETGLDGRGGNERPRAGLQ